jgi:hypothetical protein
VSGKDSQPANAPGTGSGIELSPPRTTFGAYVEFVQTGNHGYRPLRGSAVSWRRY